MPQGSINMPGQRKAPIEGIMQALQAVQAAYGINTESQRAKLIEAQTGLENQKLEGEQRKRTAFDEWMKRSQAAQQPVPTTAPKPQGPASATGQGFDTGQPGNNISPMAGFMRAAASPKADRGMVGDITKEDLNNPYLLEALEPVMKGRAQYQGLERGEKELTHLDQSMKYASNEERRKGEKQFTDFSEGFNKYQPVIEARDDISAAKAVNDALTSLNPADMKLAKAKLPLLALGIKRLGDSSTALVESQQLVKILEETYEAKLHGRMASPMANKLIDVANRVQVSAAERLNDLANTQAQQISGATGRDANWVKEKLLIPGGAHTREAKHISYEEGPYGAVVQQGGHTYHWNYKKKKYK